MAPAVAAQLDHRASPGHRRSFEGKGQLNHLTPALLWKEEVDGEGPGRKGFWIWTLLVGSGNLEKSFQQKTETIISVFLKDYRDGVEEDEVH